MRNLRHLGLALTLGLTVLTAYAQQVPEVKGGGAAFANTIYTVWALTYTTEKKALVSYVATNSAEGIKQITARAVDFVGNAEPLTVEQLAKSNLVQFPVVAGGLAPIYNLKGIGPGQLRLTGQLLADIFLGKINRWNDPAIASVNPGLSLPSLPIIRIVREPGAATTTVFTAYLAKVSAEFGAKVGSSNDVRWPAEVVVIKGHENQAKELKNTLGGLPMSAMT